MAEPSKRLLRAASRRAKAVAELEAARLALADAIRADLEAGVRQVDIAREAGYTREAVRRIARTDE